jgi:hypothetical protein
MTHRIEVPEEDDRTIANIIGEAIGEASVCWENPGGAGVFDDKRAGEIVDKVLKALKKRDEVLLLQYSEWLDTEGLAATPKEGDERTHDGLVKQFLDEQDETKEVPSE